MFDQFAQVGFQPHQDRLCFRIAQTAVEFNRLDRTILADHQSGIKETSVGRPFGRHAAHRRQNDFTHCLGVQFRRHHRRGRVGTHAPRIGPGVTVENALVILTGCQRQYILAVDHDDEARFLALQKLLDDDTCTRLAKLVARQHGVDGLMRFGQRHGHHHALAGSQPVRLDDDRRTLGIDVTVGFSGVGKSGKSRRRNLVPGHEALGKILGGFQLCRFAGWPENLQPSCAEKIDDTRRQRRFRANNGHGDAFALGKISQGRRIDKIQVFDPVLPQRSGVTRCNIDFLHHRRLGQTPGQRVLTTPGTDDE